VDNHANAAGPFNVSERNFLQLGQPVPRLLDFDGNKITF